MAEGRYLQRVEKEHSRLVYDLYMKESASMTVPFETLGYDDFVDDVFDTGMFFFWRDEKDIYCLLDLSVIMIQPRSAQFGIVSIIKRKGYGYEALKALFNFSFRSMGLHRLWCVINSDNRAALSCAKKLSMMKYEGKWRESRFKESAWIDQYIYSVLESEV